MSGLVLKLSPYERVLINGAVIENGHRRSKLSIVTPNANILRLRDAIRPDEANTPVRRVCYIAQLVLSGDVGIEASTAQLRQGIAQLKAALCGHEGQDCLTAASKALEEGDFYRVLKSLRGLLDIETTLMAGRAS
ncbi:flagellar biosynthesis repressor FlbT [Salipiger sp. IMCC34102]|uniref:flagellar biosynthesis repressor FlbT n=1 Tax=Salipiger sp. IMCC34102 TaxID=2510647 RepID=UPI00101CF415|nr:flagellar biosynthesis repressor FlbT [Salipiger sp. IMCC34102]RYH01575.1 flagellar biosynthesis repressor FlbT [Salipiger sp. IMCC34102]